MTSGRRPERRTESRSKPVEQETALPFAVRVRGELWESLVSMLRAYANAASLTHGEFAVTVLPGEAWARHKGNVLGLSFNPANGMAGWRLTAVSGSELRGRFEILESGALRFDGGAMEMDMEMDRAAIEWVEHLIRAAAQTHAS